MISSSAAGHPAASIAPITLILDMNDGLIRQTLHDLPAEAAWQRPTDHGNPILWIVGHVTQSRAGLLTLLGEPVDTGWGDLFKRGAQLHDAVGYPSLPAIKATGVDLTKRLRARLATLSEEELDAPMTGKKLPYVTTVRDALAFFAFHEAYHVGQLGYVKKSLGYAPIADA